MRLDFDELIKHLSINLEKKLSYDVDLDVLYKVIEQSTVLEQLDLSHNKLTIADGKLANAIAKNKTIKVLYLYRNNISDEGAKYLADALKENNTSLQKLSVSYNNIGDEGAKYIAKMLAVNKTSQEIDLRNNNIGDKGAESIAASLVLNTGIRWIFLGGNSITDVGAEKLADALEHNNTIEYLDLSYNYGISKDLKNRIKVIVNDRKRKKISNKEHDTVKKKPLWQLFQPHIKSPTQSNKDVKATHKEDNATLYNEGILDDNGGNVTNSDDDTNDASITHVSTRDKSPNIFMQQQQLWQMQLLQQATREQSEPPNKRARTEDIIVAQSLQQKIASSAKEEEEVERLRAELKRREEEISSLNESLNKYKPFTLDLTNEDEDESTMNRAQVRDMPCPSKDQEFHKQVEVKKEKLLKTQKQLEVKKEKLQKTQKQLEGAEWKIGQFEGKLVKVKQEKEDIHWENKQYQETLAQEMFEKEDAKQAAEQLQSHVDHAEKEVDKALQECDKALGRAGCPMCQTIEHRQFRLSPCGCIMCWKCIQPEQYGIAIRSSPCPYGCTNNSGRGRKVMALQELKTLGGR